MSTIDTLLTRLATLRPRLGLVEDGWSKWLVEDQQAIERLQSPVS